ncbi:MULTISPECIES: porin family protein [Acetobacter]|uniref:porin n=1 Tax=Acetobacter TaxID=434 RepID=UPI001C044FA9|nr:MULTISPECIES: porin [Acetobacter]MCP1270094.1 porin [Acetobacter cerevisiae]MCP1278048.1 porin [Acetobacter cerevisiae]
MASRKRALLLPVVVTSVACAPFMTAPSALADDYSDLLDILQLKGSLTRHEHDTLLAKHLSHTAGTTQHTAPARTARPVRTATASAPHHAGPAAHTLGSGYEDGIRFDPGAPDEASSRAELAANRAEASARSAQEAMRSTNEALNSNSIVRVAKYVPGKGLTFKAGPIDINFSGFVNGFYTYNSPAGGRPVAGGVSTGSSGFDSSSVRNGLLPAGFILKLSTTQSGIDMSAVLGMYPGVDNAKNGAFNANTGGSPVGLGTAGIDLRQVYVTVGTKAVGTFKFGRDLAIFGSDAILNDATLLSVGSTGSNAAPGNTSLGRIGVGYVYADWIPQISYVSPKYHGLQGSVGVFQPLDEFNFAGGDASGRALSASSTQHSSPMVQGKGTYDFTIGGVQTRIWASFLVQHQQGLTSPDLDASSRRGAMVEAGEIGTKITYKGFQGVAYYYRGSGLGTTGLFFDGIANNGRKRASEGYYVQAMYNFTKKFKLVGSYGVSNLYQAPGENSSLLVRRNQSEVGAAFYSLTDWLNLVAEYAHTESAAHGPNKESDNSASAGVILLF